MPRKTEELFALANAEDIDVIPFPFQRIHGLYMRHPGLSRPCIGIRLDLYNRQCSHFRTVLAEELGHHFTAGRGNSLSFSWYRDYINMRQDEMRARRWAAEFMCPPDKIRELLARNLFPAEMAEYFMVDVELVLLQLERITGCKVIQCA